jgi:hypothetical protein
LGFYCKREGNVDFRKSVKLAAGTMLLGGVVAGQAQAVQMWHSDTVFANQGMCAANFTFDSQMEPVQQLRVHIQVLSKKNNKLVAEDVIEVDDFGSSSADRYATGYWYNEIACDQNLRVVVTGATAVMNGERVDLLAKDLLEVENFVPYEISITPAGAK